MYHVTNLGSAGRSVSQYTNEQGYVPEAGDTSEKLGYTADEWDVDEWAGHVDDAVRATAQAEAQIAAWQVEEAGR